MLIHKFIFRGQPVLLDVNSGAVHLIDQLLYDILDVYANGSEFVHNTLAGRYASEDIAQGLAEIEELTAESLLFSPLPETEAVFAEEPLVKSLCLNVAHTCNLRCRYCFAGGGFAGQELMDEPTGRAAVEFAIQGSKTRQNLDIDFFGGEPLVNFPVVKRLIQYIRQRERETGKKIKTTLTTNGLLLDGETLTFLNRNNVLLVLSLDGRPAVHDRMRPKPGGGGSYREAAANIARAINARKDENYYLRGTYTKENLDFTKDVESLLTLGSQLSLEPVVEKDAPWRLGEEDLPALYAEYDKLAGLYLERRESGRPFNFFHFNIALDGGPCLPKRLSGCGAGHEYFAVTPGGDIYPCHQFIGRPEYLMGNLRGGIVRPDISARLRAAHVLNKPACRACWARFHCSGGCHANADLLNGDVRIPYELGCLLQKKRIECAIGIQALIAGDANGDS